LALNPLTVSTSGILYLWLHSEFGIADTRRNLERLLRKKVEGLCVHVAAKMASHTLRILLRQLFGIDVLTFEQTPVQPFGQLT
jgi:hypothetical protein